MIRSFCGPHSSSQRILWIPLAFQSIGQVRLSRCVIQCRTRGLCSCFIAGVASVFGWSEVILHSAFLLWAVAAVLGTFTSVPTLLSAPGLPVCSTRHES